MEIDEIRRRITELAEEKKNLEESLLDAMTKSILETANENPDKPKMVGNHMMVISSRKLLGKPWSMEFMNWEESARAILNYLSGTPAINWKQKLTDLLKTDAEIIELKKRGKIWYDMTAIVQRTPINRLFIEKIIEKI